MSKGLCHKPENMVVLKEQYWCDYLSFKVRQSISVRKATEETTVCPFGPEAQDHKLDSLLPTTNNIICFSVLEAGSPRSKLLCGFCVCQRPFTSFSVVGGDALGILW